MTTLTAQRDADRRYTFSPSSGFTFADLTPLMKIWATSAETPALTVTLTPTGNGSSFVPYSSSLVLTMDKADLAALPEGELYYDITLTDGTGFENALCGGSFELYGDGSEGGCGGCEGGVLTFNTNGQCVTIVLQGGSLAVGASISLAALNAAVAQADASSASAAASAASVAGIPIAFAAPTGAGLVGFVQAGTGAVARTAQSKLRDFVSVLDFGAVGDGATNNDAAFAAARAYAASASAAGNVVGLYFPAGRYVYSASPNWAIIRLHMHFEGEVWMICTGVGAHGFILDGGASGTGVYGMKITGEPQIYAAANGFHGVYARALFDCDLSINVRSAGNGNTSFYSEWLVDCDIRLISSGNEGGFNIGTPGTLMQLTTRGVGEDSSYNRILASVGGTTISKITRGIFLDAALGNEIKGTVQNCVLGLETTANAWENKFLNVDFEGNDSDFKIGCRRIDLNGCDFEVGGSFESGALGGRIRGGRCESINVKAGAVGTLLDTAYNRTGSGTITNAGTRTRRQSLWDATNQVYGQSATGAFLSPTTPTWTYQNVSGETEIVNITGGTVTQIESSGYITGATSGQFVLKPLWTLTVTSSIAPGASVLR